MGSETIGAAGVEPTACTAAAPIASFRLANMAQRKPLAQISERIAPLAAIATLVIFGGRVKLNVFDEFTFF